MSDSQPKDLPCSLDLLQKTFNFLLAPLLKSISISFSTFQGSGNTAHLKYLIENSKNWGGFNKRDLFLYIDMPYFTLDADNSLFDSLAFGLAKNTEFEFLEVLEEFSDYQNFNFVHFSKFLRKVIKLGARVHFIIDSAEYLTNPNFKNPLAAAKINLINLLDPVNISFLFVIKGQIAIETENLSVYKLLAQTPVTQNELIFDDLSAQSIFSNLTRRFSVNFDENFISKAIQFSRFDPSVLKSLGQMGMKNDGFQQKFIQTNNIEDFYKLIGEQWLKNRYSDLVARFDVSTVNDLTSGKYLQNGYLASLGFLQGDYLLNPLFTYFVKAYLPQANLNQAILNEKAVNTFDFNRGLTGKELLLLTLFKNNPTQLVTREKVAETLWGSTWEQQYTDWALDKTISRLRKKLKETNEPFTIHTAKKQGYICNFIDKP